MTQATCTFESGVALATIQTSDPGTLTPWDAVTIGASATAIYSTNQAFGGSLSGKLSSSNGAVTLAWSTAVGTLVEEYGRFMLYATTFPAGQWTPFRILNVAALTMRIIGFSGTFLVQDSAGQVGSNFALALNTWYRFEYHIVHSATVGQIEVRVYPGNSRSTVAQIQALNVNTGAQGTVREFGQSSTAVIVDAHWDAIVAGATNWPGPLDLGPLNIPGPPPELGRR